MDVIKRDGRKVDFDKNKITSAIIKAMKSVNHTDFSIAEDISNSIEDELRNIDIVTIEDIQYLVETSLMKSDMTDVARSYIEYRHWRDQQREGKKLDRFISDVIDLNNLENENANMDENVFTAKKERVASKILEDYATKYLLTPKVREAWLNNELYIHDYNSYAIGMHNCALLDLGALLEDGFETQNGDVREPSGIESASQLTAVGMQCNSNEHFGGVAIASLDYDLAPYVAKSFRKIFKRNLENMTFRDEDKSTLEEVEKIYGEIRLGNEELATSPNRTIRDVFAVSKKELEKVVHQSMEGLIHNLNTLQSRSGNQLPFTSVNFGTDTSEEGRLVSKSLLKSRIEGVGKNGVTPVFPIGIFKHKKGVNANPGDPNYDLKKLAIESTSKRIYPNFANLDAPHLPEPKNKHWEFATINYLVA